MNTRYFYALTLNLIECLHKNKSWCGETHIQKNMYIFESVFNIQEKLNFTLYKHGPYSFILHDIINELYGLKFIEAQQKPPYGPRICLTEQGRSFMERQKVSVEDELNEITSHFGGETVQALEKHATALFILQKNPHENISHRASELHRIKPHISLEDATEATQYMDGFWNSIKDTPEKIV